jgi:hypothetical protein
MTPADALRDLLAAPLRFGDPSQLKLLEMLRAAESLIGSSEQCRDCYGTGEIKHPSTYCRECGEPCANCSGDHPCRVCAGSGVYEYKRDHVYKMQVERIAELVGQAA